MANEEMNMKTEKWTKSRIYMEYEHKEDDMAMSWRRWHEDMKTNIIWICKQVWICRYEDRETEK